MFFHIRCVSFSFMFFVVYLILTSIFLVTLLKIFSNFISEMSVLIREELSPYECGFEHHNMSRIPFSLRYFFLTLIFLLFDLEIVFILFLPYYLLSSFYIFSLCILFVFVLILYLSLIYEWNDGTLEWLS